MRVGDSGDEHLGSSLCTPLNRWYLNLESDALISNPVAATEASEAEKDGNNAAKG